MEPDTYKPNDLAQGGMEFNHFGKWVKLSDYRRLQRVAEARKRLLHRAIKRENALYARLTKRKGR